MKQIELELKKRLLIVELSRRMEYLLHKDEIHFLLDGIHLHEIKYGKFELICKGSELTEEVAGNLVFGIEDKSDLQSFISAIEAQGYYWGENPLGEETIFLNGVVNEPIEWQRVKMYSKIFNPEKTLIFEILL